MKSKILGELTQLLIHPSHPELRFLRPSDLEDCQVLYEKKRPARGGETIVRDEHRIIVHHLLSTYYVLCVFTSLFNLSDSPKKQIYFAHFTDKAIEIHKG